MAKSTKGAKKKNVRSVKTQYDCDDVELYLDRAIKKVREEIIPKIRAIDDRDKIQYDAAKKIIQDSFSIIESRQLDVEQTVTHMEKDLNDIYAARKEMTTQLTGAFEALHNRFEELHVKLDAHIDDESKEFTTIRDGLTKAAQHVEAIQQTLDNVSANGNKGLSASITDVYKKLSDLESVTQGARARAKFYTVLHDVVTTTPFLKPLKHKWGVIVYAAIFLLFANTVLHALGVDWDLIAFFKWVFTFGKLGG